MDLFSRGLKIKSCLDGDCARMKLKTNYSKNYVLIRKEIKNPQTITMIAKYITNTYSK